MREDLWEKDVIFIQCVGFRVAAAIVTGDLDPRCSRRRSFPPVLGNISGSIHSQLRLSRLICAHSTGEARELRHRGWRDSVQGCE